MHQPNPLQQLKGWEHNTTQMTFQIPFSCFSSDSPENFVALNFFANIAPMF